MRKLPNRAELEAQRAFVDGKSDESVFSLQRLDLLSQDEIVERIDAIEAQAWLLKARLIWELRKRFPSDKEFGQYLNVLRNSTSQFIASSSSQVSKLAAIGRFCEEHKISDMGKNKVYQESLYELARLEDKVIASKILKTVRNKHMSVADVKRIIQQETVVHTIENEPVEVINHDEPKLPYVIPVIDNVAVGADLYVQQVWPDNINIEPHLTIMVDDSHFANSRSENIDSGIGNSRLETIEDRVAFEVTRILDMGLSITENIKKADELIDIASKVKAHFLNMRYPKK